MFDFAAHDELDTDPAGTHGARWPGGTDLEGHRLLMGGAVGRRCGEQPDIVGLAQVAHQLIDEPACRWRANRPVLGRNDNVEPAAGAHDAPALPEPAQS